MVFGKSADFEFIPVPPPLSVDETAEKYAHRLEELGFDEMRIRKEVGRYYSLSGQEQNRIFSCVSDARIRYITMIHEATPAKPHKGLVKKLVNSFGISEEEAEKSVCRFEKVGGMPFVPWTRPKASDQ